MFLFLAGFFAVDFLWVKQFHDVMLRSWLHVGAQLECSFCKLTDSFLSCMRLQDIRKSSDANITFSSSLCLWSVILSLCDLQHFGQGHLCPTWHFLLLAACQFIQLNYSLTIQFKFSLLISTYNKCCLQAVYNKCHFNSIKYTFQLIPVIKVIIIKLSLLFRLV